MTVLEMAKREAHKWVDQADLMELIGCLPKHVFESDPKKDGVNEKGEFVRTPAPNLTKVREAAKKSRGMSLAAREATSQRMKKYWAERRKAKSRKKK